MSNIKLKQSAGSGTVTLKAAASGSNDVELTLPNDIGSNDQYLKLSNVSAKTGELSFATPSGGAALTGSTNNTVTTVTGANAIQGEANLTFDGTHLGVGTATPAVVSGGPGLVVHGTTAPRIRLTNDTTGQAGTDGSELSIDGTTKDFWIENREDAEVRFATNGAERFILENDGDVTIKDGDLVIGTSGHGIDFSAGAGGDATSNILDEYEEGTYTAVLKYNNSSDCGFSTSPAGGTDLYYTKIGRQVHVHGYIKGWTMTTGDGSNASISLPFASTGGRNQAPGSVCHYTCFNHGTVRCAAEVSSTRMDFFQDNSTSRTTWSSGTSNYLMLGVTYFTDT